MEPAIHFETSDELIPADRYTSREFAQLEMERLWLRVWQIACREQDLPGVGDYIEYEIGDQSVLLVRDGPASIKGYRNACLHRGTKLKAGAGCLNGKIRCPYHGWTWAIDGKIQSIPGESEFSPGCVERANLALPEVLVDTWGGFVFVNFDLAAESLRTFLGPLPDRLDRYQPGKMSYVNHRSAILPCNWKTATEAFTEVYHLETTHALSSAGFTVTNFQLHNWIEATHPKNRPLDLSGPDAREILARTAEKLIDGGFTHQREVDFIRNELREPPNAPYFSAALAAIRREMADRAGHDVTAMDDWELGPGPITFHCFPNVTSPAGLWNWNVSRFRPNGLDPDSCIYDRMFLHTYPEGEAPPVEEQWISDWRSYGDQWGVLFFQDLVNIERVQQGMHQRSFKGARLSSMESSIRNFHRAIDRYLQT